MNLISERQLAEHIGKKRQWLAIKRLKGQLTPRKTVRYENKMRHYYDLDEAMLELGVQKSS